ncbi:MAG: sigma-E factor regulatory protein RseB domain-containing protein [Streptosporangiaceae bacterium]
MKPLLSRPASPLGPLATIAAMTALLVPCLLVTACTRAAGPSPPATSSGKRPAGTASQPVLKPGPPRDGGPGLQLLQEAAQAGSRVSYEGVEMVSAWGAGGDTTVIANIWHHSGGDTLVQSAVAGTAPVSPAQQPSVSDDTDSHAPEGVLGVTGQLVALLGAHYDLAYVGTGSADSRSAQVVEARRENGSLAARFWLDQVTKLPLRREVFDSGAHLVSEDVFIDLEVGASAADTGPATSAAPAKSAVSGTRLAAVDLTQLRARGWPVPAALPGGLSLFEAGAAPTRSGQVLDLGYSDGLFVVSVFMQRGVLPAKLAGWQKITLDGRDVYTGRPDQPGITWEGRGFVFTVMADAPAATLDKAVDTLPYNKPPGFWKRLSQGFGRLATWVNPFR